MTSPPLLLKVVILKPPDCEDGMSNLRDKQNKAGTRDTRRGREDDELLEGFAEKMLLQEKQRRKRVKKRVKKKKRVKRRDKQGI